MVTTDDDDDDNADDDYDNYDDDDDDNDAAGDIIGSRKETCFLREKKSAEKFNYQKTIFPRVDHLIKYYGKS